LAPLRQHMGLLGQHIGVGGAHGAHELKAPVHVLQVRHRPTCGARKYGVDQLQPACAVCCTCA
jgi:hypothetical protein